MFVGYRHGQRGDVGRGIFQRFSAARRTGLDRRKIALNVDDDFRFATRIGLQKGLWIRSEPDW